MNRSLEFKREYSGGSEKQSFMCNKERNTDMKINGYTRACGLIGNPVEHTMSPAIHHALAEALGENLVYVPFRVIEEHVGEAVRGAYALNLLGCNVTVPYKSRVIPFLKEIDSMAEQIGAVNTLVRVEGGFKGYNTDMPGLYRAMCEDGIEIRDEKVLVLGAGGVARAVAVLLADKGAQEILILNRTFEKAAWIAEETNVFAGRQIARAYQLEDYRNLPTGERYLVIQTTNVGMFPDVEEAVIEDGAFYEKVHTGYDLIFNPFKTKFMSLVERSGGRSFNGLKMLLYQGIIAHELWTGAKISGELSMQAYKAMMEAMGLSAGRID